MDEDFGLAIIDQKDGIKLEVPVNQGVTMCFYMSDDQAAELVELIDNKLNERLRDKLEKK